MANITWTDRTDATTATGETTEWSKDQANPLKAWANQPVQIGTTFTDTGTITTDETIEYSTIRTVTGSTHTLTAATSGNVQGNYKKVRYTFDVDCTLTLTDFDNTGSTVGTVNPIPAGTYDLWFFTTPFGVALLIQNNTGTTPGTLSTPTLVLSVGNTQLGYSITGIDSNATAGVLEYSTDNVNWTTWGSYSFGTETGNITGLTNGILYYARYRNSASGYNPSGYATDTKTPASGVTQLTQPTGLTATAIGYRIQLAYNAIDANADSVSIQRSLTSGSGFSTITTISRGLTSYDDTSVSQTIQYYYRIIANGSGDYSSSDPSAEANDTALAFTNTQHMIIDSVNEGMRIDNDNLLPSDGAGNDSAMTWEFWYKTPSTITGRVLARLEDSGQLQAQLGYASSGTMYFFMFDGTDTTGTNIKRSESAIERALVADTLYHIVAVYSGNEQYSGLEVYIDKVAMTTPVDGSAGSYTGLTGDKSGVQLFIPRSDAAQGEGLFENFRTFNKALSQEEINNLNPSGSAKGLWGSAILSDCIQENRFEGDLVADVGTNGTSIGTPTYGNN
jgi:hypothetical protein